MGQYVASSAARRYPPTQACSTRRSRALFGQRVRPFRSDPAIAHRGVPSSLLSPLPGDPPVVSLRKPGGDYDAMPELRRVRIFGMGLEYPAHRPSIDRYEPGSVAELGPSTRHGCDRSMIPATSMLELDRAEHSHLADDVGMNCPGGRDRPSGETPFDEPPRGPHGVALVQAKATRGQATDGRQAGQRCVVAVPTPHALRHLTPYAGTRAPQDQHSSWAFQTRATKRWTDADEMPDCAFRATGHHLWSPARPRRSWCVAPLGPNPLPPPGPSGRSSQPLGSAPGSQSAARHSRRRSPCPRARCRDRSPRRAWAVSRWSPGDAARGGQRSDGPGLAVRPLPGPALHRRQRDLGSEPHRRAHAQAFG